VCSLVFTRRLRGNILHVVTSVNISRLMVLSKLVKKLFGSGTQKESRKLKKLRNEERHKLCCSTEFN